MAIDSSNWGGVVVSSNLKKTTATFKVDNQGNFIPVSESTDETSAEKMSRLQAERAKKLGIR